VSSREALTTNQVRGFWAAWGGWALDGMDSFIYALVLTPALRELLPRSGHANSQGEIGYYGGLLFALFLVGWGCSFLWGPVGDRFGRVRTLMLTILFYSAFTFLGSVSMRVWQLAIFRLLAGIGIGGEWTLGGTFVAEEWPESRRVMGAGWMHTGYYFGILVAAGLNASIGVRYGWRAMFAIGGLPALLLVFIRKGVREPARWQKSTRSRRPLLMLFSPEYRTRTILNSLYLLISIVGLWAGSVWVPASIEHLAGESGLAHAAVTRAASLATIILSVGTILGCLALPPMAERIGRLKTLAWFYTLMFFSISIGFGFVYYLDHHALEWFYAVLFFLGLGGANFTLYTLWLPEQYRTECRASAFAFATSIGRFAGAGITFLVGSGVAYFHTIGTPVALTSIAFLLGLALIPFGVETKGHPLPE